MKIPVLTRLKIISDAEAAKKICLVYRNTISGFSKDGICALRFAAGGRIERNRVSSNLRNGIFIKYTENSIVNGNYTYKNEGKGILLQGCPSADITDNFSSRNGCNGIEINAESDNSRIQGNICGSNSKSGLCITDSKGISVDGNTFDSNKDYAVEFINSRINSNKDNEFNENGHSDNIRTKNSKISEE